MDVIEKTEEQQKEEANQIVRGLQQEIATLKGEPQTLEIKQAIKEKEKAISDTMRPFLQKAQAEQREEREAKREEVRAAIIERTEQSFFPNQEKLTNEQKEIVKKFLQEVATDIAGQSFDPDRSEAFEKTVQDAVTAKANADPAIRDILKKLDVNPNEKPFTAEELTKITQLPDDGVLKTVQGFAPNENAKNRLTILWMRANGYDIKDGVNTAQPENLKNPASYKRMSDGGKFINMIVFAISSFQLIGEGIKGQIKEATNLGNGVGAGNDAPLLKPSLKDARTRMRTELATPGATAPALLESKKTTLGTKQKDLTKKGEEIAQKEEQLERAKKSAPTTAAERAALEAEIGTIQTEIATLKTEQETIQKNVKTLEEDKNAIEEMQQNFEQMKNDSNEGLRLLRGTLGIFVANPDVKAIGDKIRYAPFIKENKDNLNLTLPAGVTGLTLAQAAKAALEGEDVTAERTGVDANGNIEDPAAFLALSRKIEERQRENAKTKLLESINSGTLKGDNKTDTIAVLNAQEKEWINGTGVNANKWNYVRIGQEVFSQNIEDGKTLYVYSASDNDYMQSPNTYLNKKTNTLQEIPAGADYEYKDGVWSKKPATL